MAIASSRRGCGVGVVLVDARHGRGLYRGTTEARGSYFEFGGRREN
jgi:hypothetical protein